MDKVEKVSETELKITTTTVQTNIIKLAELKSRRNILQKQISMEDAEVEKRRVIVLAELARIDSAIAEAEKQGVVENIANDQNQKK
jgi:hypothetical protein